MPHASCHRTLTVVVPVYRQWAMVEELLDCLMRQTLPKDYFRIVLVNNEAGFDASRYANRQVEVIDCGTPGAYAARNRGIEHFIDDTQWFVFTDADCRPEPDWLVHLWDAMQSHGRHCLLSGHIEMVASSAKPGWAEIHDLVKGIPQKEYAAKGFGATANLAVPADAFRDMGGFDASAFSGGDRLLCLKAGRHGYPLHYVSRACVNHPARTRYAEISTKARRIRGAQVARSRGLERLARVMYSLSPPVLPVVRLSGKRNQPIARRIIASLVQCRIWLDEIPEVFRALRGGGLERR
ncbi:glycosyltransferase family 2 protein [Kushneria sp. EE4]